MPRPLSIRIWLAVQILFLALVAGGMGLLRQQVLDRYGAPAAHGDWTKWREAAPASAPVLRTMPKSNEPPPLVLLRDHFAVCLAMAEVLGSLLLFTLIFLIQGIVTSRPIPNANPVEVAPRQTGNHPPQRGS